ncbi:MAG: 3-keto-disaccharide hydrolase, partial [Haloferula sp.]
MKTIQIMLSALLLSSAVTFANDEGFVSLMDGKTFEGWKKAIENEDTWLLEDGAFVAKGKRCHLFYVGDDKPFKNFHLKVEVMTEPNSNGGIFFHTAY